MLPVIREIRWAGATSLHQIAVAFDAVGVTRARGGPPAVRGIGLRVTEEWISLEWPRSARHENAMSEVSWSSWWQTLPGVLTGAATFVAAVGSLIVVLNQIGVVGNNHTVVPAPPPPSTDHPTPDGTDHSPAHPGPGKGINCKTTKLPIEQAICDNADLSKKDLTLYDLFVAAKDRLSGQAQRDLTDQELTWIRERDKCGGPEMVQCLDKSYDERISQLLAVSPR